MKKLLMMVLPGVLALSVSASVAMENNLAEKVPGNTTMKTRLTLAEEQQFLDIVSKFMAQQAEVQDNSQENTYNELYPRPERIDGTDNIPHWVCNP